MSMVVMSRKARTKKLLSEKNATSGSFALNYTNTGKNLMGRTASRAKHLPPRLACCGPSEHISSKKKFNFGSTTGIERKPILQVSYRNRLKRLGTSHCRDGSCRDLDANSLWKLAPEQHASSYTKRLALSHISAVDICCNEIDNNSANICSTVVRSQNSNTAGRIPCGLLATTESANYNNGFAGAGRSHNVSASEQIARQKSRTLNDTNIINIKPFNTKRCTPSA